MTVELEDTTYLDEINTKATGRKIKYLAQCAGYSQKNLAELMSRETKTISNYYCGKSLPDKIDLILLSNILRMPPDELLVYQGDLEGYRRNEQYFPEYDEESETLSEAIERSKKESKLFLLYTKGYCNIRNLKEAGYCLEFLDDADAQDIRNRMMDALLSGSGVHNGYIQHIFENYIWRKLSIEEKADCETQFAIWRGEYFPEMPK